MTGGRLEHLSRLQRLDSALGDQLPMLLAELGRALEPGWPDYAKIIQINEPEVFEAAQIFVGRLVAMAEHSLQRPEADTWDRDLTVGADPMLQTVFETGRPGAVDERPGTAGVAGGLPGGRPG